MNKISSNWEKALEEFTIFKQDKEALKSIFSNASENEPPAIFYSLTHLKHNYITLTHLFNLAKLAELGCNIIIVLWDMNILANPYFKKIEFEKYSNLTAEQYLKQKKDEILKITSALGINNIKIYTASEIWTRFTQQKEPALFTKYYSTLATMDLDEYNINEKISYLIQLPADIFFTNFFHNLYPEDAKKPVEIIYTAPQRKILYLATRKAMHNEGLITMETPAIIMSKEIPRIEIDTQIPHWDMSISELNQIVSKWHYSKEEIEALYKNVIMPLLPDLVLASDSGEKTIKPEKFIAEIPKLDKEQVVVSTAKNLFNYFQKAKELTKTIEDPRLDFYNIKTNKEAQQIATLLKSKNIMRILVLANGTRTVSEIAKAMNMQLSNTSQYIAKLKKAGLLTIKDKKVKRTVMGIKLNFDASLQ